LIEKLSKPTKIALSRFGDYSNDMEKFSNFSWNIKGPFPSISRTYLYIFFACKPLFNSGELKAK